MYRDRDGLRRGGCGESGLEEEMLPRYGRAAAGKLRIRHMLRVVNVLFDIP